MTFINTTKCPQDGVIEPPLSPAEIEVKFPLKMSGQ